MPTHILGIRHHGSGSARNVKAFLEKIKPDVVLVEGPPEADGILQWAENKEMKPPVAILCYQPDDVQRSVFYPFAEFSPEWQAIKYAQKNNIQVYFMDLPIAQQLAVEAVERQRTEETDEQKEIPPTNGITATGTNENLPSVLHPDPISYLAEVAGYEDAEKWWEQMFEHRHKSEKVFEAVAEAMFTLRESLPLKDNKLEKLREAHMRKIIRQKEKESQDTIAVICGAWHTPALMNRAQQKEDNDLLKALPKVRVECTWVPWTYNRLSYYSGYGAGIQAPGWYEHLWHHPMDDGTKWMCKVAQLFRRHEKDTSVADVIEAVRLAECLAALRNYSKPGLEELNEATLSVLCHGEHILLQLINEELLVSDKLGKVPVEIPKPPLQVDIEKLQKKLRLPPAADFKDYVLDLRKENDLERSVFLHRLQLLQIKWGEQHQISGKGTFKEQWRLQWDPAFSIDIIEKGSWGNTVEEAANRLVMDLGKKATSLLTVAQLLQDVLPAELNEAAELLIRQINNLAAASGDVMQLMEVVPPLASVIRYGNVRKTDSKLVLHIVESITSRICVSLPNATTNIDDEASQKLLELVYKLNDSVKLLESSSITAQWQQVLSVVAANRNTTPVIAGYALRLLKDYGLMKGDELIKIFSYHMSPSNSPDISGAWLEGFLKGSATVLLIDNDLWSLVNNWVAELDEKVFIQVLPLLRRTFSNFSQPERRKLGEKVKSGDANGLLTKTANDCFDHERGSQGIPVVLKLLGLKKENIVLDEQ